MSVNSAIKLRELIILLQELEKKLIDYTVWLSSDEEGNNFYPINKNASFSVADDKENKRIIFFPDQFYEIEIRKPNGK